MKAFIIINLINGLLSLSVTVLYTYPKSNLLISICFFLGVTYFTKLLIEQIFKQYGKSIK
jgi:hypothetical protein